MTHSLDFPALMHPRRCSSCSSGFASKWWSALDHVHDQTWPTVKVEVARALGMRAAVRREGWWN